jgi:hypothetical protein
MYNKHEHVLIRCYIESSTMRLFRGKNTLPRTEDVRIYVQLRLRANRDFTSRKVL